jgi:hypothetical protein
MLKKGFVIRTKSGFFINWQGLEVDDIKFAMLFTHPEDAVVVSNIFTNSELIHHEREENDLTKQGSYFDYHKDF